MKQADLKKLSDPTPAGERKSRSIKGKQVTYVDARFVEDRLDDVCGVGHWQNSFKKDGYGFICTIEIYIDELETWVGKSDGGAQDPQYVSGTKPEDRSKATQSSNDEDDYKGGLSDAFKRAGVKWGIARDLYQPDKPVSFAGAINEKAVGIVIEDIKKALDQDQQTQLREWMSEKGFSLKAPVSVRDEDLEEIYAKISSIKEPL